MQYKLLNSFILMDDKQSGLDKSQLSRRKSAMVLYQLEQTLGDFVCNQTPDPNDLPAGYVKDLEKKGRTFDRSTTRGVVAATYLDEVLRIAQDAAKGRPEEEHLKRLRNLFDVLEVFSIRNAISHPNKAFHPCYWYRVAVMATDPLIDKLQFRDVTQAFLDTEAGRLFAPPEEWINEPIWSLPNNLPQQFDHAVTGLIGRQRDVFELNKAMRNKKLNLIALVAPGGLGKTALLLESLHEIVHSPESADWVDRILYFSSKTEVLTANGINKTPAAETIEDICASIARTLAEQEGFDDLTFEDACKQFGQKRILLCLDNLETILRDESYAFENFYNSLSDVEWRVIITSRINVNGAYTMPLKPLDSKGSQELARNYLSKRGGERLSEDELKNLVSACNCHPLTIRLTIDGFIAGKLLTQCISTANEQVLEFSYKNLIEALSPVAYEVLECLFVTTPEPISRARACILLQRSVDEIAESFGQLQGTSLVTRIPDQAEESYILSSSVRDLMVFNPVDLSVRSSVQAKVQQMTQTRIEIETQRGEQKPNQLLWKYIPESAPDDVQVISADAFRELSRLSSDSRRLSESLNTVKQTINSYGNHSVLHRIRGLILLLLDDRTEGKRALRQAWEMEPPDVASGLRLSLELRIDKDLKEAKDVAECLLQLGWDNPERSDAYHARMVIQNCYLPLIWLGETDKVIEATKDWQNAGELRGIKGSLLAQALGKSVEYGNSKNAQKVLSAAVDVLTEVFNLEGYAGPDVAQGMKLVKHLVSRTKNHHELSEDAKLKFTTFVDKHLVQMCLVHNDYTIEHPDVQKWVKELSTLPIESCNNPLTSARWTNLIEIPKVVESEADVEQDVGWISVRVYYRPIPGSNGHKPFLFAKDKDNRQYYVHREKLRSADKIWTQIKIDDSLEVLPEPYGQEGGAQPVLDARLVRR